MTTQTGASLGSRLPMWAVVLLAPVLAGCEAASTMLAGDDGEAWSAAGSFAVTLVGGGVAMFRVFHQRFRDYNLAKLDARPWELGFAGWVLVWVLVGAAVAFALYNVFSEMDPDQKLPNIVAWCVGALVGGAGAFFGGRRLAHMRFRQSADDAYHEDH